ncbi:MAG: DUF4159 domain-containing protein [Acidobacteria bacterium]|nr:DUF4159 domain-containing protein [Acidobacteriota bacterium]
MAKKSIALLVLLLFVLPMRAQEHSDIEPPEFVFARLIYGSGFGSDFDGFFGRRGRGRSWATDYPEADYKFMYGIQRLSNIRVQIEENPVGIMESELFKYPFVYAVEVGHMNLSTPEAQRLREYLLRGGFLYADDFWGVAEWRNFALQMRKVFPERQIEELPLTHEVFHTFFDIDRVMQIPNINNGCSGYRTWEDPSDTRPGIYGIKDDRGRLMVLITYNSDLGDAWEWMDEPCYPELYSGQAYRMGLNFIVYAMTH